METPNTPSRINTNFSVQATPANKDSGSSLSALKKFHINEIHNLVWSDVLTFQKGSFTRLLCRQLSSVGAIKPLKESDGRRTMPQIEKELQECLGPIIAAMNTPHNNGVMNTIRIELQNYCLQTGEKDRYSHFVKAANTALLLLADVQIGESRRCPGKNDNDFLLFTVHDPKLMRSPHKGVLYGRKPNLIAAFQGHIRDLYGDTSDLLEAVRRPPKEPLHWKRALLCVEKKLKKKRIEKMSLKTYSVYNLQESDCVERTVIETELITKEKEERSKSSHPQSELEFTATTAGKRPAENEPIQSTQGQEIIKDSADNDAHRSQQIIEIETSSAAARVAGYAAETMYNCFGRSHVVNLLVTDSTINVWYFDHESPIQMTGFDFIDNLPYFFLFLFTLQRFSLADWGYIPNMVDINEENYMDISQSWDASLPKPNVLFFAEQGNDLRPRFGLNGRATGVASGTVTVQGVKREHSVVVKLSYPEKSRVREHQFVQEAGKRLKEKQYDDVCDYLPKILGSEEYHDFDSDLIRKAVLVNLDDLRDKAARIPYLIVLPKYEPIASRAMNWVHLLNAFLALVYCHAMLWSVGIEHGDISEANLMWDPVTGKPKICDFDLSHFTGQQRPTGFSNTGTWAFMALELLTPEAMQGEVQRFYRHDLESFFAILIWILCRYRDGKLLSSPPLEDWTNPRYLDCAARRKYTYRKLPTMEAPNGLPEDKWKACVNATLRYELQQQEAVIIQHKIEWLRIAGMAPVNEFYQSINILGPMLLYPLFQIGDGPKFVERLRKRLPDLPLSAPSY